MFAQASSALLMMALSLAARAEDDVPMPPLRTPDKDVAPRRAGPSEPLQYFPPPVDPAQVPSPASSAPRESLPVSDRWRIMQSLGLKSPWFDPYNQNLLKGDLPVYKDWFVNLGVVSDALLEARRLPTPVGPQTTDRPGSVDVFGRARQSTLVETLIVSLAAIKGNTTFKPPDYEFRLVPVFNVNRSQVDEIRALRVDPREGATRNDNHVTLQEAFADVHLRNVSSRYDFDSIRVGIQPFISDFRGFLFNDLPLGVRVFGTRDNNQWQYNLGIFRRLEKDTNSGLNDIRARPRRDDVFVANAYRQDWPMLGFTSQATAVLNVNREDNRQFYDSNGFLVRPAVQGDGRGHNYTVGYLGYSGDGHLGSLNLTTSLYLALGRDDRHPISQRSQRIRAGFAAAELSKDFSWVRVRLNALLASADRDPFDDVATGFDAILENPQFAGADTSFWIRQAVPLVGGGGVALSGRNGVLPSLRSSKDQGQSNFVNPGLVLLGGGADVDVSPEVRLISNVSYLQFVNTEVLGVLRNQAPPSKEIGIDISAGVQWRPFMSQNVVVSASAAALLPGKGLKQLYDEGQRGVQYSVLVNLVATF
ncbi:MAG: hypothetical protein ABIQ72_18075 [Usitatibacter sp.]